jgi:hypothetical protein
MSASRLFLIAAAFVAASLACTASARRPGAIDQASGGDSAPLQRDSTTASIVGRLDFGLFTKNVRDLNEIGTFLRYSSNRAEEINRWISDQLTRLGYKVTFDSAPAVGSVNVSVYATKYGSVTPGEMYIVSTRINTGANNNGSGVSLALELARVLSAQDLLTDRSVRFIFWASSYSRLSSTAYASDRRLLQGRMAQDMSGDYPEPTWLGIIHHEELLFDRNSRPDEVDLDVEFQRLSRQAGGSEALARLWKRTHDAYALNPRAEIGNRMRETHAFSFIDLTSAINVSANGAVELARGPMASRAPHEDDYAYYGEADYVRGFGAVQASLALIVNLAGARIMNQE